MTNVRPVVVRREGTRTVDVDELDAFLSSSWGGEWIEIVDVGTGRTLEERGRRPLLQDPEGSP